jgi:hypothetical protein
VKLAKRDMGTKKGNAYDIVMGKQFARKQGSKVAACVDASGTSVPKSFQAVIIVREDGTVRGVSVDSETDVSRCILTLLSQEAFPKPPSVPFHDLMEMKFE